MADADKWGIPFFHPTAADAGVSGEGSGFFWQQNNNIRVDQDRGMLRLGKESDDVEVINTTTGEWEFPFASGADYFCHEGRQGHKSGGEEHGCEGSCYIWNVEINTTPPKFYWQKQMYHGGTKYTHSSGKFTHSRAIEKVVGNGWKGFGSVIYTKKDGRSTGQNSAILEIWWNEDPVNHLRDGWFMVKRIEDKGGWGRDGDSCNGMDDQVITWSNIQHRFKSGTPDFSLHPRKPEFEDGPVIHSIGEEDMDFAASNRRGYGYREDMPRDFEMKGLFKFDSNDGICRLKNLSLREIDGSRTIDETPDQPDQSQQPGETQTIQGKFKLMWDLNAIRASECAGIGAGGAGGSAIFYEVFDIFDDSRVLTNHTSHAYRTRIAEKCSSSSNEMNGKTLKQLDVKLMKAGTPGASPTVRAKIWNSDNSVAYTSPTAIDPTTLSDSVYTICSFDFSGNTNVITPGRYVGVEYTGTSDTNYIITQIREANVTGGVRLVYNANSQSATTFDSEEFCCRMWS